MTVSGSRRQSVNPFPWTNELQACFIYLKRVLASSPVFRLSDASLSFGRRTEAYSKGLLAVLLQYHLGYLYPVAYASRKLIPRNSRYSTIYRVCLLLFLAY